MRQQQIPDDYRKLTGYRYPWDNDFLVCSVGHLTQRQHCGQCVDCKRIVCTEHMPAPALTGTCLTTRSLFLRSVHMTFDEAMHVLECIRKRDVI